MRATIDFGTLGTDFETPSRCTLLIHRESTSRCRDRLTGDKHVQARSYLNRWIRPFDEGRGKARVRFCQGDRCEE